MRNLVLTLIGLMGLAACDGPQERAGAKQDKAAADAAGVDYSGSGPAERSGATGDRAEAAAAKAREATADALDAEVENYQRQTNVEVERLKDEAEAVRRGR